MNVETEDFLEHYGIKGMHWGIRNESSRHKSHSKNSEHKTLQFVKDHKRGLAIAGAGALFAASILASAKYHNIKMSEIAKTTVSVPTYFEARSKGATKDIIRVTDLHNAEVGKINSVRPKNLAEKVARDKKLYSLQIDHEENIRKIRQIWRVG